MSLDGGEGSAEQAAVLRCGLKRNGKLYTKKKYGILQWKWIIEGCHRYSSEKVKQHILEAMKGSKADTMFHGVEALKRAAEEGHPGQHYHLTL